MNHNKNPFLIEFDIKLSRKRIETDDARQANKHFYIDKPIVVIGPCEPWRLFDNLKKMFKNGRDDIDVACVNDVGIYYPGRFQHWISLERKLPMWYEMRRHVPGDMRVLLHIFYHDPHIDQLPSLNYYWKCSKTPIMSGIFAAIVCKELGYKKIILCGIPADDTPRFFDPPHKKYHGAQASKENWKRFKHLFKNDCLKSMSGFTKELFGEPTKEWLVK